MARQRVSLRSKNRATLCLSDLKTQGPGFRVPGEDGEEGVPGKERAREASMKFPGHSELSVAERQPIKERTKLRLELLLKRQSLQSETNQSHSDKTNVTLIAGVCQIQSLHSRSFAMIRTQTKIICILKKKKKTMETTLM